MVQLKEGSITLQKEALLLTETGIFSLTEEETEMARVLLEYGQEHTFIVEETPIAIRRGVLGVQAAGDGFTVQLTFQKKAASATPTETQCRKLEALCVETVQRCWDAGADILSLGSVRAAGWTKNSVSDSKKRLPGSAGRRNISGMNFNVPSQTAR
ncbi:hypothetical protein DXA70_03155 [Faecalibacterium sp. OF04-11AC]|uniref:hypothetical protein n=1 Tax=Faecalibacterium sp. OF04-11AC TaxID=2293109 RepID=UPI000E7DE908|nr:hypothetical protein [Faecalibacterium sp. OF04-11AC]RGF79330.1 hypothetical protein DXA70_03155 [Faecalibacterium sp. OF04-11AC]